MDNRTLFRSVVADIAKMLRIKRIWPGEFNANVAVFNGTSQIDVNQARQLIDNISNITPRVQGVQYGTFDVSLKYHVSGSYNETDKCDAAFFEAIGSFTYEQQSYIVAVTYVDVSFMNTEAAATAMIVIYPASE